MPVVCSRETYQRKIQEQENLGKSLREKQKYVRESQDKNVEQMRIWRVSTPIIDFHWSIDGEVGLDELLLQDYARLMECKLRLMEKGGRSLGAALPAPSAHRSGGADGQDVLTL